MNKQNGVSEVIGSILLISLVGIAVAIVAVMFLSQPVPVEVQSLNVIATYKGDEGLLLLYHDGGDAMVKGEYRVQLDPSIHDPIDYPPRWVIGEYLPIEGVLSKPDRIQIISTRGGQDTLIKEITIGTVITPGPITPSPRPPSGGCSQEELDEYLNETYVEYYTQQLANTSIYFTKSRRDLTGQQGISGFINLTITSSDSYLIVGENKENIMNGSRLSIEYNQASSANIFSIGNKGFTFSGSSVNIRITGMTPRTYVTLTDGWITSYNRDTFESTLSFEAGKGSGTSYPTRLVIKNNMQIDEPTNSIFTFTNIRPAGPYLFILNYPSVDSEPVRFVGLAQTIKRGNTIIYKE